MAKDYGVRFEKILKRKYLKNVGQLQQSTSNVCGLYCAYYVVKRHQGKTMKDIVKDFNVQQKKRNDRLIVTKMMKLCTRKRPVQRKWCHNVRFMQCLFWLLYYNRYKTHLLVFALFLCFLDKSSHPPPLYPYWYPLYPCCTLTVPLLYPHCIVTASSLYPYHYTLYYGVHDSIVKCSFVCLFVNALDPCKINIEKYTNVVLFLRFPAKYWPNYSRLLTCARVCLSVWLHGSLHKCGSLHKMCVCVCVCLSAWFSVEVCACLWVLKCVFYCSGLWVLCCHAYKYENTNLGTCEHDGFHAW